MAGGPEFFGLGVGDWATWFGAAGSVAAALAAAFAARMAVEAARLPVEQAKVDRRETAMAFASSVQEEMRDVSDLAREFELAARIRFGISLGDGRRYLGSLHFNPMLATSRAMPFVNCFDRSDAAAIVAVIAAKGALDTRISALGRLEEGEKGIGEPIEILLARAERSARLLSEAADRAKVAMSKYRAAGRHD